MGAPRVTEAAIQRAIKAAQLSGIQIGAVTVNNVDGTVRIEALGAKAVDEKSTKMASSSPKQWDRG
jgi:predicted transcriptional regulator